MREILARFWPALLVLVLVLGACRDEDDEDATTSEVEEDVTDGTPSEVDVTQPRTSDLEDTTAPDPDVTEPDVTETEPTETGPGPNPCGGQVDLRFDGAGAEPGDACGGCGDGVLVCDGENALRCIGGTPPNACGGCSLLGFAPASACGPCGDGVRVCADGELVCEGASETQACGGCGELNGVPGGRCEADGAIGFWQCFDRNGVECLDPGDVVCFLPEWPEPGPGTPCGTCGLGRLACGDDGDDELACDAVDAGVGECGGCGPLPVFHAEECGPCESTWSCGDGAYFCDRSGVNACGGCDELAAEPGDACEGGVYACTEDGGVACVADAANACGGTESLAAEPGAPCGACGSGVVVCGSPNVTVCVAVEARNACGGCDLLQALPGEPCGRLSEFWVCDEDGGLRCNVVDEPGDVWLELELDELELAIGETVSVSAWAVDAFGVRRDVTAAADWLSENEEIVTVDNGEVLGIGEGETLIRVSFGDLEATAEVRVLSGEPDWERIEIRPGTIELEVEDAVTLQLVAIDGDGAERDITAEAAFSIDDGGIASLSDGVLTAVSIGETTLRATWQEFETERLVRVRDAYLSLRLTADRATAPLGLLVQLTVEAEEPDGSFRNVVGQVTWEVEPDDAGTVDAQGRFRSLAEGEITIRAHLGTLSDEVEIEVTAAEPAMLEVRPSAVSMAVGAERELTAWIVYTDETDEDVTGEVIWVSRDTDIATVDGGVVTAVAEGQTAIDVSWQTFEATASVLVTLGGTPVGLDLIPGTNFSIDIGACVRFETIARFSDANPLNVTAGTAWSSSSPRMSAAGAPNVFCATETGPATIIAQWDEFTTSVVVTVTGGTGRFTAYNDVQAGVHMRTFPNRETAADEGTRSIVHMRIFPNRETGADEGTRSLVHRNIFPNRETSVDPEIHNVERN